MTPLDLFDALSERIPAVIEAEYHRHNNCILATRLAVEVGSYFGVHVWPMAVRVFLMNAQFAVHVKEGDLDVKKWEPADGSYSVGIGYGSPARENGWDGHLIAAAAGCFGDFAIRQAERLERGIHTGAALYGPRPDDQRVWTAVNEHNGTVVWYERTNDGRYRLAPDWKDEKRRRKLSAPLIRELVGRFSLV